MGFDHRARSQACIAERVQFEPRHRTHDHGAGQLRGHALGTRHVGLHIQLVRAHIGKGTDVMRIAQMRRPNAQGAAFLAYVQLAPVNAAMEQVDVAQKAIHKRAGRLVPYFLRRTCLLDLPVVHQHYAVGHFQRFFLIVRHKNTGDVQLVMQAAQPAAQLFAHLGVQRAKRLVQQQHPRLHSQSTSQGNALTLTARKL